MYYRSRDSPWTRKTATFRKALSENFGIRGARNLAAWTVAGSVAYVLWIKPEQQAKRDRELALERRRRFAEEKGLYDVDKARPIPDPQVNGLRKEH